MKISNPTNRLKAILAIVFTIALGCVRSGAQTYSIDGPSPANQGQNYMYTVTGYPINSVTWQMYYGGTITSTYSNVCYVTWTVSTSGALGAIVYDSYNYPHQIQKYVTINSSAPSSPPNPTVKEASPGSVTLERTGSPPSGVTWYWQSSASGTSTTLGSGSTKTVTSGSVYYLRAYNGTAWSSGSGSVSYTIPTVPSNQNYIYTVVPREGATAIGSLPNNKRMESFAYFDGLGRPMQNVAVRGGGNSQDIITHIEYDQYGRQDKEYLPYSSTSSIGLYRSGAQAATKSFYDQTKYDADFPGMNTTTINPYSEKTLEPSPLARVQNQAAPGYDWRKDGGHEIDFDYKLNTSNEVRIYGVSHSYANSTYTPTLTGGTSYYAANTLTKTITRDENWTSGTNHTTEEFRDMQGRVVLKRTYNNGAHDTYYVYDDYGNLTYVLPPKAEPHTAKPDATELAELCYQYVYDHRNRLVEKKVPGKGWEYIVYNKLDQPIMTQDTNMKNQNKWAFTLYDVFGRVAYTGVDLNNSSSRVTLQNAANGASKQYVTKTSTGNNYSGTIVYYSKDAYPVSFEEVHTINYYDDYTFDGFATMPSTVEGQAVINYNNASGTRKLTKGLATGSKVRVLTTNDWITTYTGYDVKGRAIYTKSVNDYLSTTDIVQSKLDFTGAVEKATTTHSRSGHSTVTTVDTYTYDHMGRLLTHKNKINSLAEEMIASNTYDDLGQLSSKGVGNAASSGRLQTVDYAYNVRGWLKQINNPASLGSKLFAFKINYNTVDHSGTKLYNGNIAETEWRTSNDNVLRWYRYGYDPLNRITSAAASSSNYNVSGIAYDKNGNITALTRQGHTNAGATSFGTMDNLVYTYETTSNKLKKVLDNGNGNYGFVDGSNIATEYTYDANGNMLRDYNKGITSNIGYNHLNLPTYVALSGGNISYIYDATGTKLKKTVSNGSTITYAGNYVYDKPSGQSEALKYFSHPEGYVDVNGTTYKYVYQYKDHLGNIRLSYKNVGSTGSPSLQVQEENNYYPFGLKHKGYNGTINSTNIALKRKFGGKELQDDNIGGSQLDWYDFGARNYDAAIGRWFGVDILSEKHFNFSPYIYTANNPVLFMDFDGNDYGVLVNRKNKTITVQATYISNSSNAGALNRAVAAHNRRSGAKFIVGGIKALRRNGRNADVYTVNYDIKTQINNSSGIGDRSGGDLQVGNDQTGTLNSYDTIEGEFPNYPNKTGGTGNDEITVRETDKYSDTSEHEIGHSLGNGHTSEGGTLPRSGKSMGVDATGETLAGVGIGGDNISRNASSPIGDGTLLNGSTNQGLENGQVISERKYNRIIKRFERREHRLNERETSRL